MSEEPARKSHAMTWTLWIVAMPLLYVLSYGPLCGMVNNGTISDSSMDWMGNFYRPAAKLYWESPLSEPFMAYADWWIRALAP